MIASLPMYDWPELRGKTDAYWNVISRHLQKAGFVAPDMVHRGGEGEDWLSPDLLFSQTCGYPFATRLRGRVSLLATPHYGVEGCDGATYSSALIVHKDSGIGVLDGTKGKTFAYNGTSSLSGFRCLTPLLGMPEAWFGGGTESGSHRCSAQMVAEGNADVAAIDALCWHFFQKFEPELARHLKVLHWTRPLPALPYITRSGWNDAELTQLRSTIRDALGEAAGLSELDDLALVGSSLLAQDDYAAVADY